jgi:hypothetical protein
MLNLRKSQDDFKEMKTTYGAALSDSHGVPTLAELY